MPGFEALGDPFGEPEALKRGNRHHHGIHPVRLKGAEPGRNVAPELDDVEVRALREEQRTPARRTRGDGRPGAEHLQRHADERVGGIRALRHRGKDESLRRR